LPPLVPPSPPSFKSQGTSPLRSVNSEPRVPALRAPALLFSPPPRSADCGVSPRRLACPEAIITSPAYKRLRRPLDPSRPSTAASSSDRYGSSSARSTHANDRCSQRRVSNTVTGRALEAHARLGDRPAVTTPMPKAAPLSARSDRPPSTDASRVVAQPLGSMEAKRPVGRPPKVAQPLGSMEAKRPVGRPPKAQSSERRVATPQHRTLDAAAAGTAPSQAVKVGHKELDRQIQLARQRIVGEFGFVVPARPSANYGQAVVKRDYLRRLQRQQAFLARRR